MKRHHNFTPRSPRIHMHGMLRPEDHKHTGSLHARDLRNQTTTRTRYRHLEREKKKKHRDQGGRTRLKGDTKRRGQDKE